MTGRIHRISGAISRRRLVGSASLVAALVGIVGVGAPLVAGANSLALLGVYAAVPLVLAPGIARLTSGGKAEAGRPVPQRLLVSGFFVALAVAAVTARAAPRPRVFFVSLAVCNTVALVYALQHRAVAVPTVLVSATTAVYHLSTTLTNAMYVGSGDLPATWIGVQNSLATSSIATVAGYRLFPNFYSLSAITGIVAGIDGRLATFLVGATTMVATLTFVVVLARRLGVTTEGRAAVPAVVLALCYEFYFVGLYSLPRSVFAELSVLAIALVVVPGFVPRERTDRRRLAVAAVVLVSLVGFHKVGQVWLLVVFALFAVAAVVADAAGSSSDGRWVPFRPVAAFRAAGVPLYLAFGVFVVAYGYLFVRSSVPVYALAVLARFGGIAPAPQASGLDVLLSEPVGVLSTFAGSSLTLALVLAGGFAALRRGSRSLVAFVVATAVVAPFYFPGPVHALLDVIAIQRFAKFALPFVVVVASLGLVTLWDRNGRAVRALLVVLVLAGGTATLANDIYSRDNPIARTGTATNYLSDSEMAATTFVLRHGGTVASDRQAYSFVVERTRLPRGWGGQTTARPVVTATPAELCRTAFLYRGSEVARRGSVLVPFAAGFEGTEWTGRQVEYVRFRAERGVPGADSRSRIYTNGAEVLLGPGHRCGTAGN